MNAYEGVEDTYDAYVEDIAVVNFYFEEPTVFQYSRTVRLTFVGFLSQVIEGQNEKLVFSEVWHHK